MDLLKARAVAEQLRGLLESSCERIEIAAQSGAASPR